MVRSPPGHPLLGCKNFKGRFTLWMLTLWDNYVASTPSTSVDVKFLQLIVPRRASLIIWIFNSSIDSSPSLQPESASIKSGVIDYEDVERKPGQM